LLLIHGYPQTQVEWHKIAPAEKLTVVMTDLRGYGDSSKPPDGENHANYSKRAMAVDQIEVMRTLGFDSFAVVGHDRGARVTWRLAVEHPDVVTRAAVLDIVPLPYSIMSREFATEYWHWFFLIQPAPFPETLIGNSAEYFCARGSRGRVSAPVHLPKRQWTNICDVSAILRRFTGPAETLADLLAFFA
jgi:haloacetate dehalogenase